MREIVTCQLARGRGWERVQLYTFTFKIVKSVLPEIANYLEEGSCRILLIGDKRLTSVRQFFFFFFWKLTTVERAGITKSTRGEIFTFGLALGPRRIRIYTKTLLYLARSVVPPRIVWDLARSAVFKTGFIPLKNRKTRSIVPPFSRTWFRECSLPDRASLHLQPPNCSSLLETTTTCIYLNFLPFCLLWSGRNVAIRPGIISFVAGKNNSGTRSEYQIYLLRSFQARSNF